MDELRRAAEGRVRAKGPDWAVRAWGSPPLRQIASAVLAARDSLAGDSSFDQAFGIHNRAFARDVESEPETLDARAGAFLGELPGAAGGVAGALFNGARALGTGDPLDAAGALTDAMPLMAATNRLEGKIARGELSDAALDRLPVEYRIAGLERSTPDQTLLTGARHEMATPNPSPTARQRAALLDHRRFQAAERRGEFTYTHPSLMDGNAGDTGLTRGGDIRIRVGYGPAPGRRELINKAARARMQGPVLDPANPHPTDPTQRQAVLDHELAEARAYRRALSEEQGVLPFASHLGPEPDLAMIYASRNQPEVFDAMLWKTAQSASPLEQLLSKMYRQFGGTAGRPIPPRGRAADLMRERMTDRWGDLAIDRELDFARSIRQNSIPLEPRVTDALLRRKPDAEADRLFPRPGPGQR